MQEIKQVQNHNNNQTDQIQTQIQNTIQIHQEEEQKVNFSQIKIPYCFFLFVNSKSGGNKAADFTKMEAEQIKFSNFCVPQIQNKKYEVLVYIYDLLSEVQRSQGFQNLKKTQDQGQTNLRAIVGGGDGTVIWVLEEMIKNGIDFEKIPIGIVPFGTGNDFSRVLGWGGKNPNKLIGEHMQALKDRICKWICAFTEDFDIWDFQIECHEGGCIKKVQRVQNKLEKVALQTTDKDNKIVNTTFLKKMMCNYFSFGIDARVGLGFDRHRSNSQMKNIMVYAWEGFKKTFINTYKINQVLEQIDVVDENQEIILNDNQGQNINQDQLKTVLKTLPIKQQETVESLNYIKGNPVCLLCVNINSYAGGGSDVWKSSRNKVGLLDQNKKQSKQEFSNQNFGDGKLEFVTFQSQIQLGLERFSNGQAQQILQGSGPFIFKFKDYVDEQKKTDVVTYFQVDGEFYQIIKPKQIIIKATQNIPRSKIKVLIESTSRKITK